MSAAPASRRPRARRTLRIPADLGALPPVRDHIADALERRGWSREDVWRVVLAVHEALTNAVEHGSTSGAPVKVRFAVGRTRARMWIRDGGRPGGRSPAGPVVVPPIGQPHGRGRLIMEALADAVDTRASGPGTRVDLVFLRHPASAPMTASAAWPVPRPSGSPGALTTASGPRG